MYEIAEIWAYFFGIFCIVAMPTAFIIYFVNLWLNKRNPEREEKIYNKSLSKFEKLTRSSAGCCLMIFGLILLAWPFYAINVLNDPNYLQIDLSTKAISSIFKIMSYFSMVVLFISAGIFYIKTGIAGKRKQATSDNIRL